MCYGSKMSKVGAWVKCKVRCKKCGDNTKVRCKKCSDNTKVRRKKCSDNTKVRCKKCKILALLSLLQSEHLRFS